ncbi:MAG: hypothetical protein EBR02_04755 [Alphaproteobacteria bacterium]|nr:hypothetical protein [Alphaproteobacteria bacterium]
MIRLFFLCLFLLPPISAKASPVVADLSNYRIEQDTNFNGTRLFLFGARNDNGDIVVVIRGPNKNFIVRKKEEAGGLWINTERMKFHDVPAFYMVASSKPLRELEDKGVMALLGIGSRTLCKRRRPCRIYGRNAI